MGVSHLEYLIFSGLAYCYFDERDIGYDLGTLFYYDSSSKENKKRILIQSEIFKTFNYYATWEVLEEALLETLSHWEVIDILDRTDYGGAEVKTGYYSIAFGKRDYKGGFSHIVIAYRGSQLFPFKEAYRDFIETDLKIGLGKKPIQFDEGLEFYKGIIDRFDYKKVELTGHSLGGGIAQYVAVMSEKLLKDKEFTPKTITFNGVGIQVEGIIKVEEFLELKKIREFLSDKIDDEKWEGIRSNFIFYLKKKATFIKSSTKLLPIPDNFSSQNLKMWDIEKKAFMSQLKLIKGLELTEEEFDQLIDILFNKEFLNLELKDAMSILKNFSENKKYQDSVINFAHSNDFTATYFHHVGKTIYVDKSLKEKDLKTKKDFLKTLSIFQTMITEYHLFDVFIPFIARKNGMNILKKENYLSTRLNIRYIASSLRKMIYTERCSKDLILRYYRLTDKFDEKSIKNLKELIVNDFENNPKLFIYNEHIIGRIDEMDQEEFLAMWFDALDRLVSPFEYQDIFDYINYVHEENIL